VMHCPRSPIRGILAAPPCTHFARSGAPHWKAKGEAAIMEGLSVVDACLRLVAVCNPEWWALENPIGRLKKYIGEPVYKFDPCDFGDPWTKRTWLWGRFNFPERNRVNEWRRRTCPQVLRAEIYVRDNALCQLCGRDVLLLDLGFLHRQRDARAGKRFRNFADSRCLLGPDGRRPSVEYLSDLVAAAARSRFDLKIPPDRHAWEIDHVVPVSEGGDHFDPANLRLLCVPCHWRETLALASRRAEAKRAAKAIQARLV
jgi:5-methylcytosine-specific restriction endonuclease McrA